MISARAPESAEPYLTETLCPYCRSTEFSELQAAPRVVRCARCGLPRLHPYMSRQGQLAHLEAYYAGAGYHLSPPDPVAAGRTLAPDEMTTLERVVPELFDGGRALDVGTNNGAYVAALAHHGAAASGLEPAAKAVEVGRSFGLDLHQGRFEEEGFPRTLLAERFKLVTFRGSLFYQPDLQRGFALTKRLLEPSGLILVTAPLYGGPAFWRGNYPGRFGWLATCFPTSAWLVLALQEQGFEIVAKWQKMHDTLQHLGWKPIARTSLGARVNRVARHGLNVAAAKLLSAIGREENLVVIGRLRVPA